MCQSIANGGRRCSMHQPGTLAAIKLCVNIFDLTPEQVKHTFKQVKRTAGDAPAPTPAAYRHTMSRLQALTNNHADKLSARDDATVRRWIGTRLEEHQLPDAATFFAIKKLVARSRDTKRDFVQTIRDYSRSAGVSRNVAYDRFRSHYLSIGDNNVSDNLNGQFDARTTLALEMMRNSSIEPPVRSENRRIERTLPGRGGYRYGYDADDGRLEVEHPDGAVFTYRNVPSEFAEQIRTRPVTVLRQLNDNINAYAYDSAEQAEEDAFGRYCPECHEYRAANGHYCDVQIENAADATTPTVVTVHTSDLTLDGARARIQQALEESDRARLNPADFQRPRMRMTARRRLWVSPLDERETITVSETSGVVDGQDLTYASNRGAGHRTFEAPDAEAVAALARSGKIVIVPLIRRGDSPSYARDFNTSRAVNMTYDLKFYCDDATGDVKMERMGDPRCDCMEYQRNGNGVCRHTRSTGNPNAINNYLIRDTNTYHRAVDPMAMARQEALNGTYSIFRPSSRVRRDGEGYRIITAGARQRARNLIQSGGSVSIATVGDNPVRIESDYSSYHRVQGSLTLTGNADNRIVRIQDSLTCSCYRGQECSVVSETVSHYKREVMPTDAVAPEEAGRLDRLSSADTEDWQSNAEDAETVFRQFAVGIDRSYTTNLDQYVADYRAARERMNAGESPFAYGYTNVTNGICDEGRKGFGVEIEFDFQDNDNRHLHDIARIMYREGLTAEAQVQRWHYNARVANPYTQWSVELDSTVGGEIVSPIMHDTRERWEQLERVCQIIRDNGGIATARAGQHVHMGTRNVSGHRAQVSHAEILKFYAAHEDSIRRVQTDPERKTHRNSTWCSPLNSQGVRDALYSFSQGNTALWNDHHTSVNLGYDNRIEFRGADASLNPAHIQAQVMMTAGMVSAAERGELNAGQGFRDLKHQHVGTNARRLEAIRLNPDAELTDDELVVSDASFRLFTDSLFDYDHGRQMMVGLAANTPWQH